MEFSLSFLAAKGKENYVGYMNLIAQRRCFSETLFHKAYVLHLTSPHHVEISFHIISHHHKKQDEFSTTRYFERERDHIH